MPGLLCIILVLKIEAPTSCILSTCSATEPQYLKILINKYLLLALWGIHLPKLLVRGEGDA